MITPRHGHALRHHLLLALALLLGHALFATAATRAQDKAALAKQEFMAGVEAFEGGRHTTALAHFQEAYRLKPHPLVRVNIANCYVKLSKPIEAVFHFKKFLGSDEGDPEQRAEIEAEIDKLQKRIGSVQLLISPDGAQVRIDDGDTRTSPIMEAVQLSEGHHAVVVSLHGYQAYEGDFQVKGGETVDLNVRLQRGDDAAPVAAPAPIEAPAEEIDPLEEPPDEVEEEQPAVEDDGWQDEPDAGSGRGISTPTIVAMAATGGALVAGITFALLFQDAEDNFKQNATIANDETQDPARRQDAWRLGRDALETGQALAALADIMFVAAAVGVGVSGYLLLEDLGGDRRADAGGRTRLAASVGPQHAGLRLSGQF